MDLRFFLLFFRFFARDFMRLSQRLEACWLIECMACMGEPKILLFTFVWKVFFVMERVEEHEDHEYEYNDST